MSFGNYITTIYILLLAAQVDSNAIEKCLATKATDEQLSMAYAHHNTDDYCGIKDIAIITTEDGRIQCGKCNCKECKNLAYRMKFAHVWLFKKHCVNTCTLGTCCKEPEQAVTEFPTQSNDKECLATKATDEQLSMAYAHHNTDDYCGIKDIAIITTEDGRIQCAKCSCKECQNLAYRMKSSNVQLFKEHFVKTCNLSDCCRIHNAVSEIPTSTPSTGNKRCLVQKINYERMEMAVGLVDDKCAPDDMRVLLDNKGIGCIRCTCKHLCHKHHYGMSSSDVQMFKEYCVDKCILDECCKVPDLLTTEVNKFTPPSKPQPNIPKWSSWTRCECGIKIQNRSRSVLDGEVIEYEKCEELSCKDEDTIRRKDTNNLVYIAVTVAVILIVIAIAMCWLYTRKCRNKHDVSCAICVNKPGKKHKN